MTRAARGIGAALVHGLVHNGANVVASDMDIHPERSMAEHGKHCRSGARIASLTVRVIDYMLDDGRNNPESYRLLITLTDPE